MLCDELQTNVSPATHNGQTAVRINQERTSERKMATYRWQLILHSMNLTHPRSGVYTFTADGAEIYDRRARVDEEVEDEEDGG